MWLKLGFRNTNGNGTHVAVSRITPRVYIIEVTETTNERYVTRNDISCSSV